MKDRIYFPNLNGLRFIAAFMVVFCHIELNKMFFDLPNSRYLVKDLGVLGVDLFFVLSGFLITYLLLKEKEKFGKINFRSFYFRRVLRIWPLYYLVVIASIFVFPHIDLLNIPNQNLAEFSFSKIALILILFVLMLPNVLLYLKSIPFAAQTWSIGTEEQFYLIWPLIISRFRKLCRCFLIIIVLYWIVWFLMTTSFFSGFKFSPLLQSYYTLLKIDVLAIGALSALLVYRNDIIYKKLLGVGVFVLSLVFLFWSYFYFKDKFSVIRIVHAVFFALIILNLVGNPKLSNLLENKVFNYLGKISYGIYMYHQIAIVLVINVMAKINSNNNFFIYLFSISITLFLSHLSYQYFEKPFLKIKSKYSPFENEK